MSTIITFPSTPVDEDKYCKGQRTTDYSFKLVKFDSISFPNKIHPRVDYEVRVEYSGVWQEKTRAGLSKELSPFYNLIIRHEMSFGDSIIFYRKFGAQPSTEIRYLDYGNNHIHNLGCYDEETRGLIKKASGLVDLDCASIFTRNEGTARKKSFHRKASFTFADLDEKLIKEVDRCKRYIGYVWDGQGNLKGFRCDYIQTHQDENGHLSHATPLEERVREIGYVANRFDEEIFRAFVETAVIPLSEDEINMLKDVIELHLKRFK